MEKTIMKEKTCCFTGHRKIPANELRGIKKRLKREIIALIRQGVCFFGTGGALGFDTLAALTVLKLKWRYPHIKLILVLPCKNQTLKWQMKDIDVYRKILSEADKVCYTSEHYDKNCMLLRNRHLVDCSGYCISYLTQNMGGTAYTVNYAIEKGLKIISVA
ncbi:MAG: SLOG family protein [Oscillospiraceae bacterium]